MPHNGHLTKLKTVSEIILSCYPDWAINSIAFLGEGDFCAAYLVNKQWVFRFAKHEKARESLKREHCLLPIISGQISLRIPFPQMASFSGKAEGSFIAYRLLPGNALSPEDYLRLDIESKNRCAGQTAQFLNELHSVDIKIAQKCGVETIDHLTQYSALLPNTKAHLFDKLEAADCRFIEGVITEYLESGNADSFRPALLHGDLSPGHVIFDEKINSVSAVIDFGDVMIGDAAWDLLWIYEDYGVDFLSRVLPAFYEKDKTDLLRRVFQFSQLEKIQWTVECKINEDKELPAALGELRAMRRQREEKFTELLTVC